MTENISVQEWYAARKAQALQKKETAKKISFQHGLSIILKPRFSFDAITASETDSNSITVENGSHVIALTNTKALTPEFQKCIEQNWHDEESIDLHHLHTAKENSILYVRIPKGVVLQDPLQIQIDGEENSFSSVYISAEPQSQGTIVLTRTGKESQDYLSDRVYIDAQAGSNITFFSVQDISEKTVCLQDRRALIKRDATLKWVDCLFGSSYTKSDVYSHLKEEGATTENTVLYLSQKKQLMDIYTASLHHEKNTYSNILTRGAVNNDAKALSRGLVQINRPAAGSNGYETQEALLLSPTAEADAIPNLEIRNHDVKCSHGSTVGQVDAEQLFYLMSRGLSEEEAKYKIIEGFFTPVLDSVTNESVKEHLEKTIAKGLQTA